MDKVMKVCDLHDGDVPAVVSVRLVGLGRDRILDVCEDHREALTRLPLTGGAPDGGAAGAVTEVPPLTAVAARPAAKRPPGRKGTKGRKAQKGDVLAAAGKRPGSRRSLQQERALVREWARQQGRDIGDKGRLPSGLVEEYRRTQGQATG